MDRGVLRPPRPFGKRTNTAPSASGAERSVPHGQETRRQSAHAASLGCLPRALDPMHCELVQINRSLDAVMRPVLPYCSDGDHWSLHGHKGAVETINQGFSRKRDR